jgi:hypothetical protein
MLRCEIPVKSDADHLLYEGLPPLMPVLDELGEGALLIGGLATMAWLAARPVGLPIRATRDVDLGIDRAILGLRGDRAIVGKLLRAHGFKPGYAEEAFRFARETPAGVFVVDLLVAPGASRAEPPILEPGLPSLAAPGLAYAMLRGATPLELNLIGDEQRSFALQTVKLDAAFVLKAALTASGARQREGPADHGHSGRGHARSGLYQRRRRDDGTRRSTQALGRQDLRALDERTVREPAIGGRAPGHRPRRRRGGRQMGVHGCSAVRTEARQPRPKQCAGTVVTQRNFQ